MPAAVSAAESRMSVRSEASIKAGEAGYAREDGEEMDEK
jgi:hypothetical protein